MRCTKEGISLIQEFEGCSLKAYEGKDSLWTIGYGRAHGVHEGDICTAEQAYDWLMEDIEAFEAVVLHATQGVALSNNQLSALVSFVFNVGTGKKGIKDGFLVLDDGEPSTMLKRLRAGDYFGAAAEFPKWDKIGGTPSVGILRRRLAEQELFLKVA